MSSQIQSSTSNPHAICWSSKIDINKLNNSSLILVAEGQIALFINNDKLVAILEKGAYPWNWVFDSPPALLPNLQVYFFSTKTFSDQRWGTPSPIMISDEKNQVFSIRAHGAFSYQIDNPKKLWPHIPNQVQDFSLDAMLHPLRAIILEQLNNLLSGQSNLAQLLKDRELLSKHVSENLATIFRDQYGLTLVKFIIQSISQPEQSATDNTEKIAKLNELYRQGAITQEEFEEKKKNLLKDI